MNEIFEVLTDAAINLAIVLIPIVFAILTRYLVLYLNQKMKQLELQGKEVELFVLQELVYIAVQSANQLFDDNITKYTYAEDILINAANKAGIELDRKQAEALVESTVIKIKSELPVDLEAPVITFMGVEEETSD